MKMDDTFDRIARKALAELERASRLSRESLNLKANRINDAIRSNFSLRSFLGTAVVETSGVEKTRCLIALPVVQTALNLHQHERREVLVASLASTEGLVAISYYDINESVNFVTYSGLPKNDRVDFYKKLRLYQLVTRT